MDDVYIYVNCKKLITFLFLPANDGARFVCKLVAPKGVATHMHARAVEASLFFLILSNNFSLAPGIAPACPAEEHYKARCLHTA